MFGSQQRQRIQHDVEAVRELVTRVEAALVVRDPGTARSVEAYEGLRKAVVAANKDRNARLSQLVVLADLIDQGATLEALRARIGELLRVDNVTQWHEPTPREFFEVLEGQSTEFEVTSPAWVEVQPDGQGRLIKPGIARAGSPGPSSDSPTDTDPPHTSTRTTDQSSADQTRQGDSAMPEDRAADEENA